MINAKLSSNMLSTLKSLIGNHLISCDGAFNNNVAYGNIQINTDLGSVEINNAVTTLPYFDEQEDISIFTCTASQINKNFKPFCDEPYTTIPINEKIIGISIINDSIFVEQEHYAINFDMAIIIQTIGHSYVISRDWFFSETITLSIDEDFDDVYPISRVISDWNNDGEYTVSVTRTKHSL